MSILANLESVASEPNAFVQAGLAMARIRDLRLYRAESNSFEAYCQSKWHYSRHYVNRLISAARLFTQLAANGSHQKPRHESQIRPLIGLPPEQAQLAWDRAAEMAGNGKITTHLVRAAVQELHLGGSGTPIHHQRRHSKAKQRRSVNVATARLLALVREKASYEILAAKVQALQEQVRDLCPTDSE